MTWLKSEWLGYAASSEIAINIVRDTGKLYVMIGIAYLISFLYMLFHSPSTKKRMRIHMIGIGMWGLMGISMILQPGIFSVFFNSIITLLALLVLYQLYYTSPLSAQATLTLTGRIEDKKAMYAQTLLKKANYSLADIFSFTIVNEQILWIIILYRAIIALRASLSL